MKILIITNNEIDLKKASGLNISIKMLSQELRNQNIEVSFLKNKDINKLEFNKHLVTEQNKNQTNKKKFNLILLNEVFNYSNIKAISWAKKNRIPTALFTRGNLMMGSFDIGYFKKKIYMLLVGFFILKKVDHIICTSNLERKKSYYLDRFINKITIIPDGPSIKKIDILNSKKKIKNYFLFLNRLSQDKGVDKIIKIWKKFYKKNKENKLIIAGSGSAVIENKIKEVCYKDNSINFCGFVEGQEKINLISEAKASIICSESESFSIATIDSLYLGTPVITNVNTPWRLLKILNIGFCTDSTEESYIKALNFFADKKLNEFQKIERNCQLYSENFNWKKSAHKLIKMVKNIEA